MLTPPLPRSQLSLALPGALRTRPTRPQPGGQNPHLTLPERLQSGCICVFGPSDILCLRWPPAARPFQVMVRGHRRPWCVGVSYLNWAEEGALGNELAAFAAAETKPHIPWKTPNFASSATRDFWKRLSDQIFSERGTGRPAGGPG